MKIFNNYKIDILDSDRVVFVDNWNYCQPSRDPFNRFYYVVKGNATVVLNNKSIDLKEGNGYILPAGELLHLLPTKKYFEQVYVHFNGTILNGINMFSFINIPNKIDGSILKKYLLSSWMDSFIAKDKYSDLDNLNREAILRLLINPFIAEGIKRTPEKEKKGERFEKVITYIDNHYNEKIKIKQLANIAFLQATYFSNTFARYFGVAPQRYICQVRINKAQYMLEHTILSIKEIASKVGYDDELYFSRLFHKYVGIPPTIYRQQRKENPY